MSSSNFCKGSVYVGVYGVEGQHGPCQGVGRVGIGFLYEGLFSWIFLAMVHYGWPAL